MGHHNPLVTFSSFKLRTLHSTLCSVHTFPHFTMSSTPSADDSKKEPWTGEAKKKFESYVAALPTPTEPAHTVATELTIAATENQRASFTIRVRRRRSEATSVYTETTATRPCVPTTSSAFLHLRWKPAAADSGRDANVGLWQGVSRLQTSLGRLTYGSHRYGFELEG